MRSILLACVALAAFAPAARADDAADAKAVVEKAITARGDKPGGKFAAMTWKDKGVFTQGDTKIQYALDWAFEEPDKLRLVAEFTLENVSKVNATLVVNGEKSWINHTFGTQELTGDPLLDQFNNLNRMRIFALTPLVEDSSFRLATAKGKDVNGKPTAAVKVTCGKEPAVTLYFDRGTGLLVKAEGMVKGGFEPKKEVLEEAYVSDYKEVGGRKFYTRAKILRDGKPYLDSTLSDQKVSEKLDAKLFEKPGEK